VREELFAAQASGTSDSLDRRSFPAALRPHSRGHWRRSGSFAARPACGKAEARSATGLLWAAIIGILDRRGSLFWIEGRGRRNWPAPFSRRNRGAVRYRCRGVRRPSNCCFDEIGARGRAKRDASLLNLPNAALLRECKAVQTVVTRPETNIIPATDDLGAIALTQARPALELLRNGLCFETHYAGSRISHVTFWRVVSARGN